MNGFYDVVLVLIIFGAGISVMNDLAGPVFGIQMADSGFHISEATVTEYQSSTSPTTVDDFTWTNLILMGLKAIGSAVLAVITIIPAIVTLLGMFGVDPVVSASLAALLQGPVWWITITGWFEWSSGRSLT
jgi:hypothetical protein